MTCVRLTSLRRPEWGCSTSVIYSRPLCRSPAAVTFNHPCHDCVSLWLCSFFPCLIVLQCFRVSKSIASRYSTHDIVPFVGICLFRLSSGLFPYIMPQTVLSCAARRSVTFSSTHWHRRSTTTSSASWEELPPTSPWSAPSRPGPMSVLSARRSRLRVSH